MTKRWIRATTLAASGLVAVGTISMTGHAAEAGGGPVSVQVGSNFANLEDRGGDYSQLWVCDNEWDSNSVYAYVDGSGDRLYYDEGGDDGDCESYQVPNGNILHLTICEDDWGADTCDSADA